MSSVFQFRSVTLIALTKSVDQTTVRVTSHSFNKLTMFRSVPLYFVSTIQNYNGKVNGSNITSLLSSNTSGSQATTACGRSGTSNGKSAIDTISTFALLADLLKKARSIQYLLRFNFVLNSTDYGVSTVDLLHS